MQSKLTPGYWKHKWRPISSTLVVDDFGVKYIGKEHVMHLIKSLKEHYEVEEDWERQQYLGITLDYDYKNHRDTPLHARLHRMRISTIEPSHTRKTSTPTP